MGLCSHQVVLLPAMFRHRPPPLGVALPLHRCEIRRLVIRFTALERLFHALPTWYPICVFAAPTAAGFRACEIGKKHGRKKAFYREIGPNKIKHLHAENGTFSRLFCGDGRENDPF